MMKIFSLDESGESLDNNINIDNHLVCTLYPTRTTKLDSYKILKKNDVEIFEQISFQNMAPSRCYNTFKF